MYQLAKFRGHRYYENGDINSYTIFYINTLDKAKLTASVRHIERFPKSGIPIDNSEVPDTAGRKAKRRMRRRRTHAMAKHYAFHTNAIAIVE